MNASKASDGEDVLEEGPITAEGLAQVFGRDVVAGRPFLL